MTRLKLVDKIPDEDVPPTQQTNLGRALYNNPGLCIPFKMLASGCHFKSHLEPRLREMVVLRISAQLKSDVEWGQHFRIATTPMVYGQAWVTLAEARDLRDGKLDRFEAKERVALEFANAVELNSVDDAIWQRLAEHYSQVEILDLTMLAAVYGMACRLTNSLDVPLDEGIHPIAALDSMT